MMMLQLVIDSTAYVSLPFVGIFGWDVSGFSTDPDLEPEIGLYHTFLPYVSFGTMGIDDDQKVKLTC
jgi:hypothetical protein